MNAMPTLVLVPGFLCDEAVWEAQLPALQRLARVQIAENGLLDSLGAMAEAIIARAPARFAIAGHSMGGRIAMEVCRRVPERVTHLGLLDTGFLPLPAGAAGARERQVRLMLVAMAHKSGMRAMAQRWVQTMVHAEHARDRRLIEHIVTMLARRTPLHQERQVNALLNRPDASDVLRGVRCPTLVLCGREDRNSDVAHHELMAGLVPGAALTVIERCGHMCTLEQPAAVTGQLCAWLATSAG
jgi:pimeloyl-ACP methyl ester carboxylesterase